MHLRTPSIHPLRRAGAAALAAAALAAAPAAASYDSIVAAGPNGSAHFAWAEMAAGNQSLHRSLAGDNSLSGVQTISWAYRHVLAQQIRVDASGAALIAWRSTGDGVMTAYVRRRAPSGSLSEIQRLSPAGVSVEDLRLAVEPDGDAIAVWRRDLEGYSVIQSRRRSAGGSLGQVRTLSPTSASSFTPRVAVTPAGTATVAWVVVTPEGRVVQARALAPDGTLSAVQALSEPHESVGSVELTVSDAGTAVVAWSPYTGGVSSLVSRARSAGGVLGPLQTVVEEHAGFPAVAGNAAGRTVYLWGFRPPGATSSGIRGRVREANGSLNPAFEVTSSHSTDPHVAVSANGHITFAWRVQASIDSVRAQRRAFDGTMSQVWVLSEPSADSTEPHLAVDGAGKATVAWRIATGRYFARTVTAAGAMGPMRQISEVAP